MSLPSLVFDSKQVMYLAHVSVTTKHRIRYERHQICSIHVSHSVSAPEELQIEA